MGCGMLDVGRWTEIDQGENVGAAETIGIVIDLDLGQAASANHAPKCGAGNSEQFGGFAHRDEERAINGLRGCLTLEDLKGSISIFRGGRKYCRDDFFRCCCLAHVSAPCLFSEQKKTCPALITGQVVARGVGASGGHLAHYFTSRRNRLFLNGFSVKFLTGSSAERLSF